MLHADIRKRRRAFVGAGALMAVGLTAIGMAMASRPDKPIDVSCQKMDAALIAQARARNDRPDEPAGAALDRAITTIAAARRLCESGDMRAARMLYQRADHVLTRFQSAARPTEER